MIIRDMTPDEEVNLATVVQARLLAGLPAAEFMASEVRLPEDLFALVRAGLTYEEIDLFMEGESEDQNAYRYEWSMPEPSSERH